MKTLRTALFVISLITPVFCIAQNKKPLKALGFYTAKNDQAHISFVHEANKWLYETCRKNGIHYDSTNDWNHLNEKELSAYRLVIFLDTRPEQADQRSAFENYMKNGGAWIGFHFSAFALTPSAFPQNWDWYHNEFLGSGSYASNTWRPTSAKLRLEKAGHPISEGVPKIFKSSPNEWYRWENDLRKNPDIEILYAIDSSSFPLGTGPKQHEIWHSGYYPVVWTNRKYRMVYFNMGHNDIDYENRTNKTLSYTFGNAEQNRVIENAIKWLMNTFPQNSQK